MVLTWGEIKVRIKRPYFKYTSYKETHVDMFEDIIKAMGDNLADAPTIFNS